MTLLHDWIARYGQACSEAPALLGEAPIDWARFAARTQAVAAWLARSAGRVVAVSLPDGPDLAVWLVGGLRSGAIVFPLPPGATAREREALLAGLDLACTIDAATPWPDAAPAPPPPEAQAIALLVATSGSTGQPKRVALTYGGLAWNAAAHAASLALPAGARTLLVSPLYHAFSLVACLLGTLSVGGAVGFSSGTFTPRGFARRVADARIDYAALPPTLLRLMRVRCPEGPLPAVLSVGAAPLNPDELREARRWAAGLGARLYHTYGLSEAGPRVSTLAPDDPDAHVGSVGRLLPGVEVRIAEDSGELFLRSPSCMRGYFPEGDGVGPDGWLPTGDRARLAPAGYLYLEGRLKDVIITGGLTVSAVEIEQAIASHPQVEACAVVPAADPHYGEVPRAFVIASPELSEATLRAHLVAALSRPKWPHVIRFVPSLPRTALGKVDKPKLKELP